MFDLTREINLDSRSSKLYRKLQIILYLTAFFGFLYLSYLIIFPHKYFSFTFLNPSSNQNNIAEPRFLNGGYPNKGNFPTQNSLFFNTSITGDYSQANIQMILNNKSPEPISLKASVRRSYEAFLYDEKEPVGFKDGSLIRNGWNYYIISDGRLRKFTDLKTSLALGYLAENFKEVAADDLKYNPIGSDLTQTDSYPNGTLFRIEDNYYLLENQKLEKFVSDQAYLSAYDASQAIEKNEDFLKAYPAADNLAGFADGTLLSNNESVYIVSAGEILPIDNPQTFEGKGYNWEDVLTAGTDEIANYQKGKLFNLKSPHPDGTIFKTIENSRYYLIQKGEKHPLPSEIIAKSWAKKSPVLVSEKSLETRVECAFQKSFFNSNLYRCDIPLDRLVSLIGFSYEFSITPDNGIQADSLSVDYQKNITRSNFKAFLVGILNSIKINYARSQ
jgi:hypothetical protein